MKTVYVFDYIGISSGMRYYYEALEDQLAQVNDVRTEVLSNYSKDISISPFLPILFQGGFFRRIHNLIRIYFRISRFIRVNNSAVFFYFCFGSIIDAILMPVLLKARNCVLDIHDPIMKGKENSKLIINLLSSCYRKAETIIYHSDSALKTTRTLGFKGEAIYVPHFSYNIRKDYKLDNVAGEVQSSIIINKCNVLYFGNINHSKGPDIFIDGINRITPHSAGNLNFIMAGKISDDSIVGKDTTSPFLHVIFRTINDDELKYLFAKSDFIVLPYRETYQSGVLEMAIRFRLPVVVSDVPYFRSFLKTYPSFGIITQANAGSLGETLLALDGFNRDSFYVKEDIEQYENRAVFSLFRDQIQGFLERC